MVGSRPDPDVLLARVQAEAAPLGHLKIFFGANAGVGKTYAMLREAGARKAEGVDVVVGVVETHARAETEALLNGLEVLPRRDIPYKGAVLREFDLDAALARGPALILVDELAHTNAPGSRHAKRWQDVEELLAAGISVYTAINVQHLESLGDVVARITGAVQHETVPDSIFDRADEVMLIDLPPEQLHQRLREGKVYRGDAAGRASENFFRKGNLIALRELALRRTAERVDAQMRDYRSGAAISTTWAAGERLLVGVGPSPFSVRLVRATRRMAAGLHAEWWAVYVETPATVRLAPAARARAHETLRLAEQLGARIATISGDRFAPTLLRFAREQNVTKLVVGKPLERGWRARLRRGVVDELIRDCGDIDVYVITGDEARPVAVRDGQKHAARLRPLPYLVSTAVLALITIASHLLLDAFTQATLLMFYLLAVVLIALRLGRGPAIYSAVLAVAAFDFFLIPPYFTFAVSDTQYLLTFLIMLAVGVIISNLVTRLRGQAELAREREHDTATLYDFTRELASAETIDDLLATAIAALSRQSNAQCALFMPDQHAGHLRPWIEVLAPFASDPKEQSVAQWVFDRGQPAGRGTQTLPMAQALYLPLQGTTATIGVLAVREVEAGALPPEHLRFLETIARQTAQAIERARLSAASRQAEVRLETERLRNTVLTSVSHELRTPLTVIAGSAESLLETDANLTAPARRELMQTIFDEADRMDRLVQNLLQMSRMDAGMLELRKEWHVLEELVGSAIQRLATVLKRRSVGVELPADLPLIEADGLLLEQVLINLLENAAKFTADGVEIVIRAGATPDELTVRVLDRGPGLDPGASARLFEPFVQAGAMLERDFELRLSEGEDQDFGKRRHNRLCRGLPEASAAARSQPQSEDVSENRSILAASASRPGFGLGLALSAAIIRLHGGRIWATNRGDAAGAEFGFALPLTPAPQIAPEIASS